MLYIEFLCPFLGYMEFLSPEYLQAILEWQKPSGCYGNEWPKTAVPKTGRAHGRGLKEASSRQDTSNSNVGVFLQHRKLLLDYYIEG